MRSAIDFGPSAREIPSARMTNSSPPRRPTVSLERSSADQPAGHRLEEPVPGLVAERVVGVLEVVEVDEEGGHRLAVAPGPHQHPVGPVEDQLAVGQPGQRVVQGPVGEQLLELLALGDVPHVGHVAGDRRALQLVGDHRLDVADGAVLRSMRNSRTAVSDDAWNSSSSRRRSSAQSSGWT